MKTYKQAMIKIANLKPYDKNARTHSSEQVEQIAKSIAEFGFTNPLLIDEKYNLIAGHGRLEAIKQLNAVKYKDNPILELPCIICEGLSEIQRKALIIADNKIALNAGWDEVILQSELNELDLSGFDMSLVGFSESEIDELLDFNENYDKSTNIDYNALKLRENLCKDSNFYQITFLIDIKFKEIAQKEKDKLSKFLIQKMESLQNVRL